MFWGCCQDLNMPILHTSPHSPLFFIFIMLPLKHWITKMVNYPVSNFCIIGKGNNWRWTPGWCTSADQRVYISTCSAVRRRPWDYASKPLVSCAWPEPEHSEPWRFAICIRKVMRNTFVASQNELSGMRTSSHAFSSSATMLHETCACNELVGRTKSF